MDHGLKYKTENYKTSRKEKKIENFKDVEQRIFRLNTKNTSYKRES